MKAIKKFLTSYQQIVFPVTCTCCGSSTEESSRFLCDWCRFDRFEKSPFDQGEILPEKIHFRFSMWQFDKGGYLQKLLHDLKYNFLKDVGKEIGECLVQNFLERNEEGFLDEIMESGPLIVPVPLHKSRLRKRGYNQARAVAEGVSCFTGWEMIKQGQVVRIKNTKTQTGLNSQEREKNLESAFMISDPEVIKGRFPVLVDDVFTTGATTFELANTILREKNQKAGILTIAQA
jgi:ComF family protein